MVPSRCSFQESRTFSVFKQRQRLVMDLKQFGNRKCLSFVSTAFEYTEKSSLLLWHFLTIIQLVGCSKYSDSCIDINGALLQNFLDNKHSGISSGHCISVLVISQLCAFFLYWTMVRYSIEQYVHCWITLELQQMKEILLQMHS